MNKTHKHYKLGHATVKEHHTKICNDLNNSYSLTVTLNPRMNHDSIIDQYRGLRGELIRVFKQIGHKFEKLIMTPEVTKEGNIHFHVYLTLYTGVNPYAFQELFKYEKKGNNKWIGTNFKFKKIDETTDNLINYPFKQNQQMREIQENLCNLISFVHTIITFEGNTIIKPNKTNNSANKELKQYFHDMIEKGYFVKKEAEQQLKKLSKTI
jgi:hypothetical protein